MDVRYADAKLVYKVYCQKNICIMDNPYATTNHCYIFFSGNGLYYPNTEEEFTKKILHEDRYEWKNLSSYKELDKTARKRIFIRDVYKQWYVMGCSKDLNTVDKLYSYLKEITKGCTVITVGNSAGGYAAVLFGILLKAKIIYSFSGQFSIMDKINDNNILIQKNKNRSYYNLKQLIELNTENTPIYWFYAAKSQYDIEQREIIRGMQNIYQIAFNVSVHGKSCFPTDYIPFILKTSSDETCRFELKRKIYSDFLFSYEVFGIKGIIRAVIYLLNKIFYK